MTTATNLSPAPPVVVPAAPRSAGPRIIALMNQKGGVGKTTTTVNLGAGLVQAGKRVLFIDLDPQAHLTLHVGVDPDTLEHSVYDLLTDPAVDGAAVVQHVNDKMSVLPAEVNLAGVESELAALTTAGKSQQILREKCSALTASFDFVLIDCPPSLGLLTLNALALAREVFVPMQAHFLALQGLSKLLETVAMVKQAVNPALRVTGVILCMYEGQTILAGEVMADLNSFLDAARSMDVPWRDAVVLEPNVRRNIKLAECPSFGKTIFDYAPKSPGANDYRLLAESVVKMTVARPA